MNLYNLKIGTKIMASFVVIAILSSISVSFFAFQSSRNSLQTQMLSDLQLVSESSEGYLLEFLQSARKRVVDFASDGYIRESTRKIVEGDTSVVENLNKHLHQNKKSLDDTMFQIDIFDMNEIVISSTNPESLGSSFDEHKET